MFDNCINRTNKKRKIENYDLIRILEICSIKNIFNYLLPKDVKLYHKLKTVTLDIRFKERMSKSKNMFPNTLRELYYIKSFSLPLEKGILPEFLKLLYFGSKFDIPLTKGFLPYGLEELHFGYSF